MELGNGRKRDFFSSQMSTELDIDHYSVSALAKRHPKLPPRGSPEMDAYLAKLNDECLDWRTSRERGFELSIDRLLILRDATTPIDESRDRVIRAWIATLAGPMR